jgi:pyruvate,orthophosphate dikinase
LGIVFPEITEMQARAVFEAASKVRKAGVKVQPEIMIPLAAFPKELELQIALVRRVATEVTKEQGVKIDYRVGTMIEIPRACLVADQLAAHAEFFSFGTNDLTQTTLGISRDDSGAFLPSYQSLEIIERNPFANIDEAAVGAMMKMAIGLGRKQRPGIKLGICGEHGGDPDSVKFCHEIDLDYVSCSPFRVPVARLAAAQAALARKRKG